MKVCRFNRNRIGIVQEDRVYDVTALFDLSAHWPFPLGDIVIHQFASKLDELAEVIASGALPHIPLIKVRLDSPVANPSKIIGAPINYRAHIEEANTDAVINHGKTYTSLDAFGLFLKSNGCLIGPSDQVQLCFPERRSDHEVELAVVIGKAGRAISPVDALDHVFGYTIGLDMTVRGPEWPGFRKSPDGYGVLGPWLVTRDEITDPNDLDLSLMLNGEERQRSNTRSLIFNVQQLIAYASRFYSLFPGDVIMTGTPNGVSQVKPGDRMQASIEGIGSMCIDIAKDWAVDLPRQ